MNSALEEYLASLPADDWRALAARVRPPDEAPKGNQAPHDHLAGINGHSDPADRRRALMASLADKQRLRPEHTDANGYRDDPDNPRSVNYVQGKVNFANLEPGTYPTGPLNPRWEETNDGRLRPQPQPPEGRH